MLGLFVGMRRGWGGGSEKERLLSLSCPSWLHFYLSPSFSIPHVFQACQGAQSITSYLFKFSFSFAPVSWPVQPAIPRALLPHSPAGLQCWPLTSLPDFLSVQGFWVQAWEPTAVQGILDPGWRNICIFIFAHLYLNFWDLFGHEMETNHSSLRSPCDSEPREPQIFSYHITSVTGVSKHHGHSSLL